MTDNQVVHQLEATGPVVVEVCTPIGWVAHHLDLHDVITITDEDEGADQCICSNTS